MDRYHAVQKIPRTQVVMGTADGGKAYTYTISYKGVLTRYLLELPTMASSPTVTLTIVDENSITIFTGAAHASGAGAAAAFSVPIDVEIDGTYTITLTTSGSTGAQGAGVYNTMWVRGM
jgi:hypothetical protein